MSVQERNPVSVQERNPVHDRERPDRYTECGRIILEC